MTAAGKHVVPAVLEDRVRAHPLVAQSLGRRPALRVAAAFTELAQAI